MLSPNVNAVVDQLAQAYSTITRVDSFAYAAVNSTIGKLSPDPDWLGPIRNELTLLRSAGAQWQQKKPQLWTPLLTQVVDYATLIEGVAKVAKDLGNDKASWIELLGSLSESLERTANAAKAAELDFKLQLNNLNNVQTVFSNSIDKAWAALDDEEQKMIALAEQVGALNERVSNLEAQMTAGAISSGQSYVVSTVSMTYSLLTAASFSVPYLSIAGLVFTVGKGVFDIISTDSKIDETLGRIRDLSVEMSEEAQAAAMSKALIHLITGFDKSLAAVGRQLPLLSNMWSSENDKVQGVIHAIQAGAEPRAIIDLVAIKPAVATWQTLSEFVGRLLQTPPMGRPVSLNTAPPDQSSAVA